MAADRPLRTLDDLLRVVRALALEFNTNNVFIVGSQAILASMHGGLVRAGGCRERWRRTNTLKFLSALGTKSFPMEVGVLRQT